MQALLPFPAPLPERPEELARRLHRGKGIGLNLHNIANYRHVISFIFAEEKVPDRPERPPTAAKPAPPVPRRSDDPPSSPAEEPTNEINYANVYQALWNCDAGDKDELQFRRGDLIYIYEKPHADWWIGSLFKPQGYSVGLVPKDYVMEAYEFSAA